MSKRILATEHYESIRQRYRAGETQRALAKRYCCSQATICNVVSGIQKQPASIAEILLSRVQRSDSDCWNWMGTIVKDGYGRVWIDGIGRAAHRESYKHFVGPIPSGQAICHRCDNPRCINPDHLFAGNQADNIADAVGKNRHPHHEQHGMAKLTAAGVQDIREQRRKGVPAQELARQYGLNVYHVYRVIRGAAWKPITTEAH